MAEMMYGTNTAGGGGPVGGGGGGGGGGELTEENNTEFYPGMNSNNNRQRFPGLYVGNLTWWTTDQDVINNINGIGVNDVQEVKFFENRNNGQSKGFCVVTFGSDASLPIVMEKLPRTELHGQNPVVTPYNRQNLNLFESQTKARPQINNSNNGPPNSHAAGIMGISSISGVHAGTQGLPYSAAGGPQSGPGMGGMGGMNNNYNQQAGGMNPSGMLGSGPGGVPVGPRGPSNYHTGMWMQMRAPRAARGPFNPNNMNPNGPMIPGPGVHQMNRMRFMQPQQGMWNNSQNAYNNPNQPRLNDDRGEMTRRVDDRELSRRGEERDSSSSRHREDSRRDDRSSPPPSSRGHRDDIRRDDRSSPVPRHRDDSRRAEERSSSSSRHRDDSRRGEERSSRREKETSSSSSSRRDKGHHRSLDHKTRSRSRERSRDRSRERSRDRRDRGKDGSRRDRLATRNMVSSGHYIH